MLKKRMTLSLVALLSSVFLFVFATFAWFAVSQIVDILNPSVKVINIEVEATLEVSDDGVSYTPATGISFENSLPGSKKHYRITVKNIGNVEAYAKISLFGLVDNPTDPEADYDDTVDILEKILLSAANDINSEEIVDEFMIDLLPELPSGDFANSHLFLVGSMYLDVEDVGVLTFSFTIDESANNKYQNHALSITNITITSVNP